MARTVRISKKVADAISPGETIWDTDLSGFGLRCQRRYKTYVLKTRVSGRQRWFTIGKHGSPWTPETARREALGLLGLIARGQDPGVDRDRLPEPKFRDLVDLFLERHVNAKRKVSTAALYRDLLERLIVPLIGPKRVAEVTRPVVAKLHHDLRETPYQANRALAVLSKIFAFAEQHGMATEGGNPCHHVEKFREEARDRFLSAEELGRLGEAMAALEREVASNPYALAAIRLLLLSGARLSEILKLKWDYVDFERSILFLPDSKTGKKAITLNSAATKVLIAIPKVTGNPWVIVGKKPTAHLVNLQKPWRAVRKMAGLEDVRIHDLRHTFASIAAGSGVSLHIIGKLLGHTQPATTNRYAHLAHNTVREAGERIGEEISSGLTSKKR